MTVIKPLRFGLKYSPPAFALEVAEHDEGEAAPRGAPRAHGAAGPDQGRLGRRHRRAALARLSRVHRERPRLVRPGPPPGRHAPRARTRRAAAAPATDDDEDDVYDFGGG